MSAHQRVLITGGSGFLGRHVIAAAVSAGLEPWSLGRQRPPSVRPDRHINLVDPTDAEIIDHAVVTTNPHIIVHLAGVATGDVGEMYRVNTVFAARLLATAASCSRAPRVFLAGSAAEYGPVPEAALPVTEATPNTPSDPYGITKLAQTLHGLAAIERGLGVVVGRLFNVVGVGMRAHLALGSFVAQVAQMGPGGGVLVTGDLDVERDFIEAADAARTVIALATRPDVTGVVDICSGVPTSLRSLVEELIRDRPIALHRDPGRRGVTALRRHFGAALRLQALDMSVPRLDTVRAVANLLIDCRESIF